MIMMMVKSPLVSLISALVSFSFIVVIIIIIITTVNLTHLSSGQQVLASSRAQQADNLTTASRLANQQLARDPLRDSGFSGGGGDIEAALGASIRAENQQKTASLLQQQSTVIKHRPRHLIGRRALSNDQLSFGDEYIQLTNVNASNAFAVLFKKKPFSKYWSVEQKWDDLFKRLISVEGVIRQMVLKNTLKDIEYYADLSISEQCGKDLKFIQNYVTRSKNMRWLVHMLDATGKNEPGMLTGNLAHLGHPIQCIRARAPPRPSNETFNERFFEQQTKLLGERFRGKYCLASIRPVLPPKPRLISRFEEILNVSLLSNVSYTGEPLEFLKLRSRQSGLPSRSILNSIDRNHLRLDQVPFESELYQYMIVQRNFMFSLPRFLGVCYPSSCSRDDVRMSLQKTFDSQHQVVDVEFECEQEEEESSWSWFTTPRLLAYILLALFVSITFGASLTRHILVDRMQIKRSKLKTTDGLHDLLWILELLSLDKCIGILFIKTKPATPHTDWTKTENNRSTSIDALKGFLVLLLIYSQLAVLGCLPLPFMWSKWADAMFPFFRAPQTQLFLNATIWSEAFYIISAYLIGLKFLENCRPKVRGSISHEPNVIFYAMKRYIRLLMPMLAFLLINYVWPRLSNGFVMQDQAAKLLAPCDNFGWTNALLFNNHYALNETCLWPSHVGASLFQLHLISYPILLLCLKSLRTNFEAIQERKSQLFRPSGKLINWILVILFTLLIPFSIIYPASLAKDQGLIVPFLIDYLDFDNYQRVIEWMLLPTYNHLSSYLVGLVLAYLVAKNRANLELLTKVSNSDCLGYYIHRESSFDSIKSSSIQEELQRTELYLKSPINVGSAGKLNLFAPTAYVTDMTNHNEDDQGPPMEKANDFNWACESIKTSLALVILLMSLTSSWYWNGLGQPISGEQTFWYLCITRSVFSLTFAYLFFKHFATRRNSNNPWMITRFLVPIGRMSLMVFYLSWLVIWFDLLASPYQWHPSHYFIGEKFNEIASTTLVLSLFVHGIFEGTIKRVQYMTRSARVEDQLEKQAASPSVTLHEGVHQSQLTVKSFEQFFQPIDDANTGIGAADKSNKFGPTGPSSGKHLGPGQHQQQHPSAGWDGPKLVVSTATGDEQMVGSADLHSAGDKLGSKSTTRCLSVADKYKLNAELRANYSFASIGLYESAGATGDLS